MLFDDRRNGVYARAIREAVGPKTVVMDLGAGLGLHGLLAAADGAHRVYLVEPEPVVIAALEAARASGLADRVVVVRDRIEDAHLPEKVDLIVSAFTGNLLFSEDLLATLYFARDHHLKPEGLLLPDHAELWLAPWSAPQFHAEYVAKWRQPVMGLNYSFAARCAANQVLWPSREELRAAAALSPGSCVAEVDLTSGSTVDCNGSGRVRIERAGTCHGLVAWIRLRIGDTWLSSSPDEPPVHWSPALLPLEEPLEVEQGETVALKLNRPAFGEWTWGMEAAGGSRRHSTFLATPEGSRDLRKLAPGNAPALDSRGKRALAILQMFDAGLTNQESAMRLARDWGLDNFHAMLEVQMQAKRYGASS